MPLKYACFSYEIHLPMNYGGYIGGLFIRYIWNLVSENFDVVVNHWTAGRPMASFTKEVNLRLAKRPLVSMGV